MNSDNARQRAERSFKKQENASAGQAVTGYEARALATHEKIERLKALRLAKKLDKAPDRNK
ncbi:MAG: hypothetical protein WB868_05525 [Xanthobacteraceae bacterium]